MAAAGPVWFYGGVASVLSFGQYGGLFEFCATFASQQDAASVLAAVAWRVLDELWRPSRAALLQSQTCDRSGARRRGSSVSRAIEPAAIDG